MACRDCWFWKPKYDHSKRAKCDWPGIGLIPSSVLEIEKVIMKDDGGQRCPSFKSRALVTQMHKPTGVR